MALALDNSYAIKQIATIFKKFVMGSWWKKIYDVSSYKNSLSADAKKQRYSIISKIAFQMTLKISLEQKRITSPFNLKENE